MQNSGVWGETAVKKRLTEEVQTSGEGEETRNRGAYLRPKTAVSGN